MHQPLPQEPELIASVQGGNRRDFGPLYDHYLRRIYDFIYYKTLHRQTAEDLTSETFFKALERLHQFDSSRGSLSSWLYRIAANTVTDHYRRARREANIDDIWDLADGHDDIQALDDRRALEAVREHLKLLSADQQRIVVMRLWQGLSHAEIAAALNRTEASTKVAFSRALKTLREHMPLTLFIYLLIQPYVR